MSLQDWRNFVEQGALHFKRPRNHWLRKSHWQVLHRYGGGHYIGTVSKTYSGDWCAVVDSYEHHVTPAQYAEWRVANEAERSGFPSRKEAAEWIRKRSAEIGILSQMKPRYLSPLELLAEASE